MRFKEFQNKWEVKSIGEAIELISGYAFKGDEISENENGIPLLRGINITEGRIRHNKEIDRYFIGNTDQLEKYFIREGDLVIGMDGSKVGKNVALIKKEDSGALLIQRVARLRARGNSDINFIYQNIYNRKFHKYVDIVNTSSGIPHISAEQINEYKIGFPTPSEQTKIARFLSLIDERIQTQNKIIEGLRVSKTSLSKKIFTQKLRFPEFTDEWETKTLNELGDFIGGGTPSSKNENFWNGEIPWISSSDLDEDNIHTVRITRFINEDAINNSATKLCIAPVILIVSRVGVGKVAYSEERLCTSQDFTNIFNLKCNGLFLAYLLSVKMREVTSSTQGTSIKGIPSSEIRFKKVLIPKKDEQQKIANFLSNIDQKIEIETTILNLLIKQKQYLLQQIFI